jgi:hyperosmotically inducible protein
MKDINMQIKPQQFILAACVSATLVCSGLTGCKTGDRSTGAYIDDRQTARRVSKTLKSDEVYKFPNVKVTVYDGVAQLSGFVETEQQKANAAALASRTSGVRQVLDEIAIRQSPGLTPTGYPTGQRTAPAPVQQFHPVIISQTNATVITTVPQAYIYTTNQPNPNPNYTNPNQPQQQQQQQ